MATFYTKGKRIAEITIDDKMFSEVMKHSWNITQEGGYPQAKVKGMVTRLHRFVTDAGENDKVIRVKGNKFDFRLECFVVIKVGEHNG